MLFSMKQIFAFLITLFSVPTFAQITLEHTYDSSQHLSFTLAQVDSANSLYVMHNGGRKIEVYNIDHSFRKTIMIPEVPNQLQQTSIWYFTTKLFNLDDKIEFLVMANHTPDGKNNKFIRIFNEDGDTLLKLDSCRLSLLANENYTYQGIINSENGTKLLLTSTSGYLPLKHFVYSLPGKLPTSNTKLSVTDAPTIISSSSSSASAYPNPSNRKIKIAYSLPSGVTTGELVITNTSGREIKRYRVGNMFNDILIDKNELAAGAYFYKLITERGESEARKFVITH